MPKKNQSQDLSPKRKSPFDLIADMTFKKIPWEEQNDTDKKDMSVFIINKAISMNSDCIEIINALQKYTIGSLDQEMVYRLYFSIFPKKSVYSAWIKSSEETEKEKINDDLVKLMTKDFWWSKQDCISNIKRIKNTDLKTYLESYGYTTKDISRITGLKITK